MSKLSKFILLFLVFFPFVIYAQSIKGGVAAGVNISQVDGDEVYGYHKFGLNAGTFAIIPIYKKFSFCLETSFEQKGSYQRPQFSDSLSGEYKLALNYVSIPLLLSFTDKNVIKFSTGFSWARLVDFKEWEHGTRKEWTTPYGPYKRSDVDFLIDIQFKITQGLHFDFRYAYSLAKIRTRTFSNIAGQIWTRKQFNNLITFRLVYIFKDSPSVSEKKKNTETS